MVYPLTISQNSFTASDGYITFSRISHGSRPTLIKPGRGFLGLLGALVDLPARRGLRVVRVPIEPARGANHLVAVLAGLAFVRSFHGWSSLGLIRKSWAMTTPA